MGKTAFHFPGQGAQQVGMGRAVADRVPAARTLFDRAGEILGFDLAAACFEGPKERLDATDVSQPALFVASFAALEAMKAERPDVVDRCAMAAGLSPGEYTALPSPERFRSRTVCGSCGCAGKRCRRRPRRRSQAWSAP